MSSRCFHVASLLNDQKIGQLLRESGLAIRSLQPGESIQSRKETFETHAEAFARLLEVLHPLVHGMELIM